MWSLGLSPRSFEIDIIKFKIHRITVRKLKYWIDFFQQRCTSSTSIKKKKEHIKVTESY